MNSCINKLVQYVNTSLEGYHDKSEMDKICASFAVMFAIKKLSNVDLHDDYKSDGEYTILKYHFSELVDCCNQYINRLSPTNLQCINDLLYSIQKTYADSNIVSWIYQELKSLLAKQALKKLGSDKNKLTGNEILLQTQFFTDDYIVKYLVDTTFEICKENLPDVVFIDPACGGGNFLTYIYKKLYSWYSKHTDYDAETINSYIFKNNIIGYDLDYTLSRIATLSLYMCSRLQVRGSNTPDIFIYGGLDGEQKGFLASDIKSNTIAKVDFATKLSHIRKSNSQIVYITNPPFMGKRDMDTKLKDHLQARFPYSKGDLCFAFMEQILLIMNEQDLFASVTQNGWMTLSSLKDFRKMLLDNHFLHTCIDMGSNAFENINGEKTNIVLSIISGNMQKKGEYSIFANLRGLNYADKKEALSKRNYETYTVSQENFLHNSNSEICYQFGNDLEMFTSMQLYRTFGKCMQGSSTGDNKTMVKYIWETNEAGWVLASKGGGYSKWNGLNWYKVKWGKQGELLKRNQGSALRNPNEIENTSIVFSDTGTLGLSTRQKLDGQVFIASGPGIKVINGNPLSHLAFLNSKLVTFFLKVLNPKFTVSAGYIGKIPVADGILENTFLSTLAAKCISLKYDYLSTKLPNYEFSHCDYRNIFDIESYVEDCIRKDLFNQYRRYIYEQAIDKFILSKYHLSDAQMGEYNKMTGGDIAYSGKMLNMRRIDKILASTMNNCCQSVSRKLNGYIIGTENCIDIISYKYALHPKEITRYLLTNVKYLNMTKVLYKKDLIHKLILKVSGINALWQVQYDQMLTVNDIQERIAENFPVLNSQLAITPKTIEEILREVHKKSFFNKPIIAI